MNLEPKDLCACKERPVCQMIACHKYADWSLCAPQMNMRLGGIMFICDWHWQKMQEPIPGIDRPARASEDWRPSISDSIRLAIVKFEHEQHQKERWVREIFESEQSRDAKRYTPAQLKQVQVLRQRTASP
jgi:hypothetical protein